MTVRSCAQAMAANGKTKCLYLHHQGEFQPNYYTFVSLHDSDHEGVVNVRSPFLQAVRLFTLISTLHYAAQFFPYQECKYPFILFSELNDLSFFLMCYCLVLLYLPASSNPISLLVTRFFPLLLPYSRIAGT